MLAELAQKPPEEAAAGRRQAGQPAELEELVVAGLDGDGRALLHLPEERPQLRSVHADECPAAQLDQEVADAGGIRSFGEIVARLELEPSSARNRLDAPYAPIEGARDDPLDRVRPELADELFRLAAAAFVEGTTSVVSGPVLAVAGGRVPQDQQRGREGLQNFAVTIVGQLLRGVGDRQPLDLVDLVVWLDEPDSGRIVQ